MLALLAVLLALWNNNEHFLWDNLIVVLGSMELSKGNIASLALLNEVDSGGLVAFVDSCCAAVASSDKSPLGTAPFLISGKCNQHSVAFDFARIGTRQSQGQTAHWELNDFDCRVDQARQRQARDHVRFHCFFWCFLYTKGFVSVSRSILEDVGIEDDRTSLVVKRIETSKAVVRNALLGTRLGFPKLVDVSWR